jgi:hypothetical protein
METSDMQLGKAGEYLVCADLIIKGFVAFPSEQGLSFDVVLAAHGRLYKVQVKATRKPIPVPQRARRTEKYCFNVRRCGKGGRCSYEQGDVDLFALVALDTRSIGYLRASEAKQTMFFLPESAEPLVVDRGETSKVRRLSSFRLEDCLD